MKESTMAQVIVDLVSREYELASNQHLQTCADLAKAETGDKLWKEREEREGNIGWSQSPYDVTRHKAAVKVALGKKMHTRQVLEYAIRVFLNKLDGGK